MSAWELLCSHNQLRAEIRKLQNPIDRGLPEHMAKPVREQIRELEVQRRHLLEEWRTAEIAERTEKLRAAEAEMAALPQANIDAAYATINANPLSRADEAVKAHRLLDVRDGINFRIVDAMTAIRRAREAT